MIVTMIKLYLDLLKYMISLFLDLLVTLASYLKPQLETDLPKDLFEQITGNMDKLHERYESFQKRILEVMKGLEQAVRAQEESAKTQKLIVEQLIVKKDERKD